MGNKAFTIVVAEDDEDDRLILRAVVDATGYRGECRFVSNARELFDYLEHKGKYADVRDLPNLIILDLHILEKCRATLKKIKSEPRFAPIPVLVLTPPVENGDPQCFDLNADGLVTKPMEFDKYVEAMISGLAPFCKEAI